MLAPADTNYWITWFPGASLATLGVLGLCWKGAQHAVEAKRTLREVRLALPKIQAEFVPNHGSSMKDRVEELHRKQDEMRAENRMWQTKHARDDDHRFERLDAGIERIEDQLRSR